MGTRVLWRENGSVSAVREEVKGRECKDGSGVLAECGPRGSWGHMYPWGCMDDWQGRCGPSAAVAVAANSVANNTVARACPCCRAKVSTGARAVCLSKKARQAWK